MGKIRSKDVKKKGHGGDFNKKKTKVGRKIKRSNVTEIKIQSRHITIPVQAQTSEHGSESTDPEVTKHLIRALHHYNEQSRLSALEDAKRHLSNSAVAKNQIALILPDALELLFHEEKETRSALLNLFSFLTTSISSQYYLSVQSVLITYICSGLTNMHKGIRKDSLTLLLMFAELHPSLLVSYKEKLVKHAITLLDDPQTTASAGSGSGGGVAASTGAGGANFAGQSGEARKRARQDETVKQTALASSRTTIFMLVLKVLHALLRRRDDADAQDLDAHSAQPHAEELCVHSGSVLLLQQKASTCRAWGVTGRHAGNRSGGVSVSSTGVGAGAVTAVVMGESSSSGRGNRDMWMENRQGTLTLPTAFDLCSKLKKIWEGLILGESSLSMDHIYSTSEIVNVILGVQNLDIAAELLVSPALNSTITAMMRTFPYTSRDAELSVPGSHQQVTGTLAARMLNISLCEMVIFYVSSMHKLKRESGVEEETLLSTKKAAELEVLESMACQYLLTAINSGTGSGAGLSFGPTGDANQTRVSTINSSDADLIIRAFNAFDLVLSVGIGLSETLMENILSSILSLLKALVLKGKTARGSVQRVYVAVIRCVCHLADQTRNALNDVHFTYRAYHLLTLAMHEVVTLLPQALRGYRSVVTSSSDDAGIARHRDHQQFIQKVLQSFRVLVTTHDAIFDPNHDDITALQTELESSFFKLVGVAEGEGEREAAQSDEFDDVGGSILDISSVETLLYFLDIYGTLPFADILDVSHTLANKLFQENVSCAIQLYFLRLVYDKRSSIPLGAFVALLFEALGTQVNSVIDAFEEESAEAEGADCLSLHLGTLSQQTLPFEVGKLLNESASSNVPIKIISFVNNYLDECVFEGVLEELEAKSSEVISSKWRRTRAVCYSLSESPAEWLNSYAKACQTLTMTRALLSPWSLYSTGADINEAERNDKAAARTALTLNQYASSPVDEPLTTSVVRACQCAVAVLQNVYALDKTKGVLSPGSRTSSTNQLHMSAVLHPVAAFLGMDTVGLDYDIAALRISDIIYSVPMRSGVSKGTHQIGATLFEAFIVEVCSAWSKSDANACLLLLRGFGLLLQQPYSYSTFDCHRQCIESVLRRMAAKESDLNMSHHHTDLDFEAVDGIVEDILQVF